MTLKYDVERIRASITEQAAVVPPAAVGGVIALPALPDPSRLLSMKGKDTLSEATTHLLAADYTFNADWGLRLSAGESRTRRDRWLWIFDNYSNVTGAGNVYGADQPGQDYLNQNLRAELNGRFKTGNIGHDVLFGVSQNRLYQPSFNTYMYRAAQNLYAPVEVAELIRAPNGGKTVLRDRAFYEQTVRNGGGPGRVRHSTGQLTKCRRCRYDCHPAPTCGWRSRRRSAATRRHSSCKASAACRWRNCATRASMP